ncbi:hypothetical protein OBBRIDRAFT_826058 [Obba rivulosa]|uniref:F-box domain-containing protein n=1 Tax=Obba rivulosa TaxID=1052685 RepID=A0A8E2ATD9_9APHY|nr:hypothetical protein OBBRIDRAFT_826058 [Obba rivulosa]
MPVPLLPPELTDEIICQLWDDHLSLKACSLTCHMWLTTSRLHFCNELHIRSIARLLAFIDSLEAPRLQRISLSHSLQHLGLHSSSNLRPDEHFASLFQRITSRLPHLYSLILDFPHTNSPLPPIFSAYQNMHTESITTLDIRLGVYTTFHDYQRLIHLLPQLSHLTLRYVFFHQEVGSNNRLDHRPQPHNAPHGGPSLISLVMVQTRFTTSLAALLAWLLTTPTRFSLRTLEWDEASPTIGNLYSLQHFLGEVGTTLEAVVMRYCTFVPHLRTLSPEDSALIEHLWSARLHVHTLHLHLTARSHSSLLAQKCARLERILSTIFEASARLRMMYVWLALPDTWLPIIREGITRSAQQMQRHCKLEMIYVADSQPPFVNNHPCLTNSARGAKRQHISTSADPVCEGSYHVPDDLVSN